MIDITNIINALVLLVVAGLSTYLSYLSKKNHNSTELSKWVKIAVGAAEQAYKTGMTQDRKQYALDVLKSKNLSVNFDEVDKMIEAAVVQLPKQNAKITPEHLQDGKGE